MLKMNDEFIESAFMCIKSQLEVSLSCQIKPSKKNNSSGVIEKLHKATIKKLRKKVEKISIKYTHFEILSFRFTILPI